MPLIVLSLLAQIACAIHVIRTGRDTIWLWLIVFVPGLGCLLYVLTQILPEMLGSRAARQTRKRVVETVDPKRELRRRADALDLSDTVENRLALADESLEAGMLDEAEALYRRCLGGLNENDPGIMEKLATTLFRKEQFAAARTTLEDLIRLNPEYRSVDGHLLYARTLEALGDTDAAAREYEVLRDSYPGEEARVRYGLMLKRLGEKEKAGELFRETLVRCKRAPRHYRLKEREWIRRAEEAA